MIQLMSKAVLAVIVIVLIVGAGGLAFMFRQGNVINAPVPSADTNSLALPNPSGENDASSTADLQAGGSSYLDPKGVFSFLYPNDYRLDHEGGGQYTRISKLGPTQRGQTEMYDGVLVVFESVDLGGKPLEQWVDESIKTSTADGTSEVIQAKSPVTVNNYKGFTYTLRGLGESKYLVLQKDSQSDFAVSIVSAVYDPSNQGFQSQVSGILNTLQILK